MCDNVEELDTPKKLEEEYTKVKEQDAKKLKIGDKWCLLDSHWYRQWKKYVTNNGLFWNVESENCKSFHPGPVDNKNLFQDETFNSLKEHLVENIQYELVRSECWDLLVEHYGTLGSQPSIERKVVEEGSFVKTPIVEIYEIPLQLCSYEEKDNVHEKAFSRTMTIEELDKEMRTLFNVSSEHETRLWNARANENYEKMDKKQTIKQCCLQKKHLVVMEVKLPSEEWTLKDNKCSSSQSSSYYNGTSFNNGVSGSSFGSTYSSTPSTSNYQSYSSPVSRTFEKKRSTPGLCGLNNLGNTCFMNSALQCLSNVPALTNHFKSNKYEKDLNDNNPLGMGGKIATTYAKLIQMIWSGENNSYAPREFKYSVGQFQSRFLGYQQQDSQELLAFLIDGLHEDLNRISKKPYIEVKDAGDRPHELVAAEAWDNHLKRNNSIIVEILHGLYRSTVECPKCPRISVTFDPFCFLTLPLPVKQEKNIECTFVPLNYSEKMMKYKVPVPVSGIITDLCKAVSKVNKKPYANMSVTDVYNERFHKIFKPTDPLKNMNERDQIYIYETPPDTSMVPVYMRYTSYSGSAHLFAKPLLVPVQDESTTFSHLYKAILNGTARFIVNEALKKDIVDLMAKGENKMCTTKENANGVEIQEDKYKEDLFDLFRIKTVNSFGSQEYKQLEDNDMPIKLTDIVYFSADWSRTAVDNYFTNKWNESVILHESASIGTAKKANVSVDLMNCMKLFTSKEQLGEDNMWYCSDCEKHQQAFKKFDLWTLPPVLIIHLKRFSNSRWSKDKLDTFIDFPLKDLDLSDFVVNPLKEKIPESKRRYNLIAVTNHYGGLGGGHYTAFAKNNVDKKWHYFDDSSVSDSSEDRVVTKAAYMLVYQRQDVEQWFDDQPDKEFPFLQPVVSPRVMEMDYFGNGTDFEYGHNEGCLNNTNTENAMDVS